MRTHAEEARMMPYQTYQLYQIERPKSAAEIRAADERAGRTAAALAGMLRRLIETAYRHPSAGVGTLELRPFVQ
jgi:hypothetical protein